MVQMNVSHGSILIILISMSCWWLCCSR